MREWQEDPGRGVTAGGDAGKDRVPRVSPMPSRRTWQPRWTLPRSSRPEPPEDLRHQFPARRVGGRGDVAPRGHAAARGPVVKQTDARVPGWSVRDCECSATALPGPPCQRRSSCLSRLNGSRSTGTALSRPQASQRPRRLRGGGLGFRSSTEPPARPRCRRHSDCPERPRTVADEEGCPLSREGAPLSFLPV